MTRGAGRTTLLVGSLLLGVSPTSAVVFRYLETQRTRTDCGPAALATALRLRGVEVDRRELERALPRRANRFTSLQELELASERFVSGGQPCRAAGAEPTLSQLIEQSQKTALIVRTCDPQPHFSVLLGVDAGVAYVADPAIGNIAISYDTFVTRWNLRAWRNQPSCIPRSAIDELGLDEEGVSEIGIAVAVYNCGVSDAPRRNEVIQDIRRGLAHLRFQPFRSF